jgi:hypothetical protein
MKQHHIISRPVHSHKPTQKGDVSELLVYMSWLSGNHKADPFPLDCNRTCNYIEDKAREQQDVLRRYVPSPRTAIRKPKSFPSQNPDIYQPEHILRNMGNMFILPPHQAQSNAHYLSQFHISAS